MPETNKDIAVALYKKALFEGKVEEAFRLYAGPIYRQHNPLIEDGVEGVKSSPPGSWRTIRMRIARSSASLPTATTSCFTLIGTVCPIIRAERRWLTSFGWRAARSSSTGT
jgi:hypothetical protein